MNSQYVLFCAPYRFDSSFNNYMSKEKVEKELLSAILPGVNMLTRKFVLHGIKANFGIEDKNTLLAEVSSLQNGDYHAYEDLDVFLNLLVDEQKVLANKLIAMTKGRLIQGFDDCRIIDVITKAYAAKLINDNEFNEIFFAQAKRIEKDYDSWEQYLASCVLGKIVQMCDEAPTIVTKEEYIYNIYSYCVIPTNVFEFSTFWNNDLSKLAEILADILQIENNDTSHNNVSSFGNAPSNELIQSFEQYRNNNIFDKEKYPYLYEMASYVLWMPIVENNLLWMITPQKENEQSLLLPAEFLTLESAHDFWFRHSDLAEISEHNIFAIFEGFVGIKAIFAEDGIYTIKKKLFGKKTIEHMRYQDAKFSCTLGFMSGLKLSLNSKSIFEVMEPNFEMLGMPKKSIEKMENSELKSFASNWTPKLEKVFNDIPKRIEEFKKMHR